jgi:hypothetical protein
MTQETEAGATHHSLVRFDGDFAGIEHGTLFPDSSVKNPINPSQFLKGWA